MAGAEMKPDKLGLVVVERSWEPLKDVNCKFV